MPKILSYTPPWLARPSPGSKIFTDTRTQSSKKATSSSTSQPGSPSRIRPNEDYQGPRRLLAKRGTEIFTVVDNKIRWADLARVKSDWDEGTGAQRSHGSPGLAQRLSEDSVPYRILTVPIYQKIRQLVISPSKQFLAILTEHTIHVAILPDINRLNDFDGNPLKLKTYQLGPTTHVIPQSPLVCALWHPLAVSSSSTDSLLTITAEAAVRVWELDRRNQWSFDKPALAIDLKKLIDGTSCDQDFAPSPFGKSKGFSADVFDMEATSACFGGSGLPWEDGWAAMTLWVAMRNGDLYALCPLIPCKWRPPGITIAALSTHIVSKMSCIENSELDLNEERYLRQQFEWMQELDIQAPFLEAHDSNPSLVTEFWIRPSNPSVIPKLQGPFDVDLGNDSDDLEVSDIHIMAGKLDFDEIFSSEQTDFTDDLEHVQGNLAATVICIATTDAVVHILLDMEGVSGQWLPKAKSGTFAVPDSESRELLLVESLNINPGPEHATAVEWPVFSSDITSAYDLYLTSSQQISFISVKEWASRLDSEITPFVSETAGLALRLKNICAGSVAFQERLLVINEVGIDGLPSPLSAPVILQDPELGHMVLTSTASRPYAISFDLPGNASPFPSPSFSQKMSFTSIPRNVEPVRAETPTANADAPPRNSYEAHSIFYGPATGPLKDLLSMNVPQRQKLTLKQEIRLSPATLDLVSLAHRTLAVQTSQLEGAAADLFRRCERLREELSNQVKQMGELSSRIQRLGNENEDDEHISHNFESRMESAKERQRGLSERHEVVRRKLTRAGMVGKDLTAKETAWVEEITGLARMVGIEAEETDDSDEDEQPERGNLLDERYASVKQLAEELLAQAEVLQKVQLDSDTRPQTNGHGRSLPHASPRSTIANGAMLVPSKLQKAKITEAMTMVERESAVIDAVMARLERLNVDS